MCKSKRSTDATGPGKSSSRISRTSTTPAKSSKRSSPKSSEVHRSPFDPSTSNNYTTTGSGYYKDSWQSPASSLSSLKDSLPTETAHLYDFSEICYATNNFLARKFSSSSSSASWRCMIRGRDAVVFQRKFHCRIPEEVLRERLSLIYRSHHTSLIKLRGASIATDLAHGLDYIHHSTGLRSSFIHNHIKSTSVIVTNTSLNARICHFGTAELCGEVTNGVEVEESKFLKRSDSQELMFNGTRGYMSPEYQATGIATQKSDVFAFGVVILELLSGEEPLRYRFEEGGGYVRVSVVETAVEAVKGGGGRLRRWMDPRLKDSYPLEVAEKTARMALDCVETDPERRPDMGRVAGRLSRLYLASQAWMETIGVPTNFTASIAAR
ncbi:protein LYK5-like [Diospyros lotus]|uniref:protein LYK5-like n=1 Tax=Diospyros lotus TaxID=55363 RepID=UPI002255A999|nr:protein LYK5-like [Diospyros lotus]